MNWIDCHNHLHFSSLGEAGPLLAAMRAAGVERCVVNATGETDWEAVAGLAETFPEQVVPMFGVHPWHAGEVADFALEPAMTDVGRDGAHTCGETWRQRLRSMLEKFPQAGVGECGLDGWVVSPGIAVQKQVFMEQVRIAREMRRTLTIHCLKAWGPLFEVFAVEAPPPSLLMHAYAGSLETAPRLLPLGAYFSFSGAFLHPRRAAALEVFRQLPRQRILLETDAPEMTPPPEYVSHPLPDHRNHPANLPAIAGGLAKALGMRVAELAELTHRNACECFGWHSSVVCFQWLTNSLAASHSTQVNFCAFACPKFSPTGV